MTREADSFDPNPGVGQVPFSDKVRFGLAILGLPWHISTFAVRRLSKFGRNDIPFGKHLVLWLIRGMEPHVPVSVTRRMMRFDVSTILDSARFRDLKSNLYDEAVRRPDFSGYWICKGPPGKPVAPASCDIVIYYIHGGGYRTGGPTHMMATTLRIAEVLAEHNISLGVFSLDYSLAPEAQFPKPINQAVSGYKYLVQEMGIDASKLALMGDSSGGHLCLCLATVLQENQLPSPGAGAVLISPWIDLRCSSQGSYIRNKEKDFIDAADLHEAGKKVLGSGDFSRFVDFSQPLADGRSWKDVFACKVWVSSGNDEIFLDDIVRFADRLKTDGVDVILDIADGKLHNWQSVADQFDLAKYLKLPSPTCPPGLMSGAENIARGILAIHGSQ